MTFSKRFDEWRIDRGLDPLDDAIAAQLDQAASATSEWMREHKDEIVADMRLMASEFLSGESVDPRQRARALLDRLESSNESLVKCRCGSDMAIAKPPIVLPEWAGGGTLLRSSGEIHRCEACGAVRIRDAESKQGEDQ